MSALPMDALTSALAGRRQQPLFGPGAMDPEMMRRRAMAEALMNEKPSELPPGVSYSPLMAVSDVLKKGTGAYMGMKVDDEVKGRQQGYSKTLADALMAMKGGNIDAGMEVMGGNPDTAPMALQFGFDQAQAKAKSAAELQAKQAEWALKLQNEPQLRRANSEAEYGVKAEFEPKIAGSRASAEAAARQPYDLARINRQGEISAANAPLVEIADPNSPSGTRLVTRGEAVNQPGRPREGMSITSDGKGGLTINQGPGAGKAAAMTPGEGKDIRDKQQNFNRVARSLDNYETILKKYGPTVTPFGVQGEQGAELAAAHTDLLMELKEAYNLGVLNGPDYFLMTKIIQDPTTWQAQLSDKKGMFSALAQVRQRIQGARGDTDTRLETGKVPEAQPDPAPSPTAEPPKSGGVSTEVSRGAPRRIRNPKTGETMVLKDGQWVRE